MKKTHKTPVKMTHEVVVKMRHMRKEGFAIGDIAREVGCTWRTAWKWTKGHA